jgi:hypothetical protein
MERRGNTQMSLAIARLPRALQQGAARFLGPPDVARLIATNKKRGSAVAARLLAYVVARCPPESATDAVRAHLCTHVRHGDVRFAATHEIARAAAIFGSDCASRWDRAHLSMWIAPKRRATLGGGVAHADLWLGDLTAPGAYRAMLRTDDCFGRLTCVDRCPKLARWLARYERYEQLVHRQHGGREWLFPTFEALGELTATALLVFADHVVIHAGADSAATIAGTVRRALGSRSELAAVLPHASVADTAAERRAFVDANVRPLRDAGALWEFTAIAADPDF